MPFYVLVYYSSGTPLPPDQVEANRQSWRSWNATLGETYGIKAAQGVVVTSAGIQDYHGNFRGASVIEADSLTQAAEIAQRSPAVAYGGRVEVFEEF